MNSVIPAPIDFSRLRALSTASLNNVDSKQPMLANKNHLNLFQDDSIHLNSKKLPPLVTPLSEVKRAPFAFTKPTKSYAKRADRLSIYLTGLAVIVVIGIFYFACIPSDGTFSFFKKANSVNQSDSKSPIEALQDTVFHDQDRYFKPKNANSVHQSDSKSSSDALQYAVFYEQAKSLQNKMNMVKTQDLESKPTPVQ